MRKRGLSQDLVNFSLIKKPAKFCFLNVNLKIYFIILSKIFFNSSLSATLLAKKAVNLLLQKSMVFGNPLGKKFK